MPKQLLTGPAQVPVGILAELTAKKFQDRFLHSTELTLLEKYSTVKVSPADPLAVIDVELFLAWLLSPTSKRNSTSKSFHVNVL